MTSIVRVWDAPTRLFHWAMVVCIIVLVATAQIGGAAMDWHFRFGYAVMSLLLFRLIWGFIGGYWSRFANFLYPPTQIIRYLRGQGEASQSVGHNPAGALSVFALLMFLALQVASGLFSDDEIAAAGPLTRFVTSAVVSKATFYHKEIGKLILIGLVALHLLAIAFYFFRQHENLVKAMITGDKELSFVSISATDSKVNRIKAALTFSVCCMLVGVVVTLVS
jgi:cytochrome b